MRSIPSLPVQLAQLVDDAVEFARSAGPVYVPRWDRRMNVRSEWQPPAISEEEVRAQAARALPAFDRCLQPASREHIAGRVTVLMAHSFFPDMPEAVATVYMADWIDALSEFPAWTIDEAARRWLSEHDRKPTIRQFREICEVVKGRADVPLRVLEALVGRERRDSTPTRRLSYWPDEDDTSCGDSRETPDGD